MTRVYKNAWRAARRAAGLCVDCKEASPDHFRCAGCRAQAIIKQRARRERAK